MRSAKVNIAVCDSKFLVMVERVNWAEGAPREAIAFDI